MSYNVFGQVTGLTFGSGDSDSFGYDSNTGRMSQYQYSIGATPQTVTGGLTWNANGTLGSLQITDQLNSANNQTCTYGYDDLVRVTSANCGSVWSQTFGFDPFGNLTKSGSVSFQPTYNTATNRITSLPGFTCPGTPANCYDANGNTIVDSLHTYTWDAEGKLRTADSINLTYDALGRMVEQSGTTQIVYSPTGQKLALMSGQTVSKAFVPLPGGAQAVYVGATLTYYRHPDWLGSSRLTTTTSRTVYSSLAYAPFGETYAEIQGGTPDRSFTGQNQDTVQGGTAGLYDFLYREYALYGRWISPDPAGLSATNIATPQSLNRYAYAWNNPTNLVDPLGLDAANPGYCDAQYTTCGGGGDGPVYMLEGWFQIDPASLGPSNFYGLTTAPVNGFATDKNGSGHWFTLYYGMQGFQYAYDVSFGTAVYELGLPASPDAVGPPSSSTVNVPSLIDSAEKNLSSTCNKTFRKVIPNYSKARFFGQLRTAPIFQYPPGTPNIPPHPFGADAVTQVDQKGRPILLLPNFYGLPPSTQSFVLVHEGIHRFTGWTDPQVFQNFSSYGLQQVNYGTGDITSWIEGGCTQ